jgi:CheY-like chemotaxis protein/two-component sensor histidine kinase
VRSFLLKGYLSYADERVLSLAATSSDELSTLKGDFLASLNHEIRTPLSGVLGMVDLLLETNLTGEQKEYLDDARSCAETLLAILNSTLEYSALSAELIRIDEADFSLRAMLNETLADFGYKAKLKGLQLTANFAPEVPELAFGDALRLQQIFTHVLSNAIKFTPQGNVDVRIGAAEFAQSGFKLQLDIRDTGIGIAPAHLDHIFDSFRQIDTGLARRFSGLGLGLAVTRKLVSLLNGNIAVKSELGQGTQFSIAIPIHTAREQAIPVGMIADLHSTRILIVEDNPVAQTVAVHILRRLPYRVDVATSGVAALEAAQKNHYSLILMDLQMPDMDGFETAERIHSLPGCSAIPIIVLTANYSQDYREMCFQRGFQGFLSKPVQASDLLKTVEALLATSGGSSGHLAAIGTGCL